MSQCKIVANLCEKRACDMQTLQNVSDLAKILLRETEIGRNDSKPWAPKQGLDVEIDRISC